MIPVYSFMEGDSLGLLTFTYEDETVEELARKVLASTRCRVEQSGADSLSLYFQGRALSPALRIAQTEIQPLAMVEVKRGGGVKASGD